MEVEVNAQAAILGLVHSFRLMRTRVAPPGGGLPSRSLAEYAPSRCAQTRVACSVLQGLL
jgi:hypothetical protein